MSSVCFFMVYHGRPALTKMSIDDMYHAMRAIEGQGHKVRGLVIGSSYEIANFCNDLGIRHEMFENKPLSNKFTYAFLRAVQNRCEYICWYGSNNVHSVGYWYKCGQTLWGKRLATFGTRNCVIMSTDDLFPETYLFHPSEGYLISSGQFFLTDTLINTVNLLTLFRPEQTYSFDGSIMDSLFKRWGKDIVTVVEDSEEDCIDVKGNENIHSYESYAKRGYVRLEDKDEIAPRHERLGRLLYSSVYE